MKGSIGLKQRIINCDNILILLLSVAKNFVNKTIIPKNVASIQIQKIATYDLDRKKINLIPNKSFRYYNL